eukprot:s3080_g5.t2
MPKPRKGGWHYGGHGGKKGGDKKGPQKGAGKRSIPIPFLPPFPPANIVPPRPKMRPNSSGDGARDDRIPRSPSHPPPRRNDKKEPAESRHEEGGDPSAPDEAMNRADGTGGTTEAPTMPVETPKAPSPPEAPKASSPSGAPKASSPSEAHATLRAALLSFSAGTPESQATSMFLRYMEDNGLMPPCPEGMVKRSARFRRSPAAAPAPCRPLQPAAAAIAAAPRRPVRRGGFWLQVQSSMNTKLESRTWSCSELVSGAAAVIDTMPAPSLDAMVVDEKHKLLSETSGLTAAEIAKLLEDMA